MLPFRVVVRVRTRVMGHTAKKHEPQCRRQNAEIPNAIGLFSPSSPALSLWVDLDRVMCMVSVSKRGNENFKTWLIEFSVRANGDLT